MDKSTTNESFGQIPEITQSLDALAREGARRMIQAALKLEIEQYIQKMNHLRDEQEHALVVRNGKSRPRTVHLGSGAVEIVPRGCTIDGRKSASPARFCHPTCGAHHN